MKLNAIGVRAIAKGLSLWKLTLDEMRGSASDPPYPGSEAAYFAVRPNEERGT